MASYGVMSFLPPATLDPKLPNPRLPEGPEDVEAVEAAAEAAAAERSLPKSRTTPARVPDSSRNSAVSSPNQSEPPPVPKFLEEASFWIDSGSGENFSRENLCIGTPSVGQVNEYGSRLAEREADPLFTLGA
ncbi:hypothetical protein FO519_007142 [Halicephalobus sp. NKZ332]|nr:hypothetical protein FO519_007142 [Halicephalobus sp. NKZ332]